MEENFEHPVIEDKNHAIVERMLIFAISDDQLHKVEMAQNELKL